MNLTTAIHTIE